MVTVETATEQEEQFHASGADDCMDMQMSVLSGIDAVRALRDKNDTGPIVMHTAMPPRKIAGCAKPPAAAII